MEHARPWIAALALALGAPSALPADHLELRVEVDPQEQRIQGEATVTLRAGELPDVLAFYLSKEFEVTGVEGAGVGSHAFEPGNGFLDSVARRLVLEVADGWESDLVFSVRYAGPAPEVFQGEWMEFFVDRVWFPVHESLDRGLTADVTMVLPEGYTVFGRGDVSHDADGWHMRHAEPTRDLNWVASPGLELRTFEDGREQVVVAGNDLDESPAEAVAQDIIWILRWFNSTFGASDPQHRLALVLRPGDGLPGYARPGYIALYTGGDLSANPASFFKFFAHEVSHLWWSRGSAAGFENWLNESFAECSSLLALRAHGDGEAFTRDLADKRERSGALPPVIGIERSDPASHGVFYTKGCVLLFELEAKLGEEAFQDWLATLVAQRAATTDEVLLLLEDAHGPDVAGWFAGLLSE